ncbi:hypothetical protein LT85_2649 [Collimonas arenae]|uniref:HPt domain-containing protein n=2 Tax=Collimonas arenae TaxID=279058 RepID=A0A0A1FG52_9BURK|nr:hypothetical protein LT85_2649 [Collimonas arenae]
MFLRHAYHDSAVCAELCTLFLQVAGEQFARLESAVQAGNVAATTHECHALKGSLLISGAHAAIGILDHIDAEFNRQKLACGSVRFAELKTEIALTMEDVRNFLARSERPAAQC